MSNAVTLRQLKNGKYHVLVDGKWQGTTLKADGTFAAGAYLTNEQAAIVKEILK